MSVGQITLVVLIVVQITMAAFAYGLTTQQVRFNRELIQAYQNNQVQLMIKIDDLTARIIKLEVAISGMNR